MNFSKNIKLLRKRKGMTQDEVADQLNMKRSTLSGYENDIAEPGIDTLLQFSGFYQLAVDTMLRNDLAVLTENQFTELEKGSDVYMKGSTLRVLATTVDEKNIENIELVPEKAKAGYTTGYADPEYISTLPTFQLPFLSKSKKYRTFQVSGDSMLPVPDGSWVTGEFVLDWNFIKSNQAYIILTMQDGIVFKMVENNLKIDGTMKAISLNPAYPPYNIHISEIKEVWKFVNYITTDIPEPMQFSELIIKTIENLRADVEMLKKVKRQ